MEPSEVKAPCDPHKEYVLRKFNNKITQTEKACTNEKVPDQPPRVAQSDHGLFCLLLSFTFYFDNPINQMEDSINKI